MRLKRVLAEVEQFEHRENDPGIEEIINYIEWLMIWYCRKPSTFIANIIVSRLEELQDRNSNGELEDPEWCCDRLLRNWEYIAERRRSRV